MTMYALNESKGMVVNMKIEEIEQLNNIIKTTNSIKTLYNKLYELEINNKKNTEEYNKTLNYLDMAIEVENSEYDRCKFNYEKSKRWMEYILIEMLHNKFCNNEISVLELNYEKLELRRILNCLSKYVNESPKSVFAEISIILRMLGVSDIEKKVEETHSLNYKMDRELKREMALSFLYFINKEISDNNYNNKYKNELIRTKYNLSFISKLVENNLFVDNFQFPNELNNYSKFIANSLDINDKIYENIKNEFGKSVAEEEIINILSINNYQYKDEKVKISSILRISLIKSSLLFMTYENIEYLNDIYDELFNNSTGDYKYLNNSISVDIVKKCISKFLNIENLKKLKKIINNI